jgi:hypothetical protein
MIRARLGAPCFFNSEREARQDRAAQPNRTIELTWCLTVGSA